MSDTHEKLLLRMLGWKDFQATTPGCIEKFPEGIGTAAIRIGTPDELGTGSHLVGVIQTVMARRRPRVQGRPAGHVHDFGCGADAAPKSLAAQRGERRHVTVGHPRINELCIRTVETDQQDAWLAAR